MTEIKDLICVTCPRGCRLTVETEGAEIRKIYGNQCQRGCKYAAEELNDPRRMIASTVRIRNGLYPVIPVTTSAPIQKPLIAELMAVLKTIELQAPVRVGTVVIPNVLNSGVDILTSRSMSVKPE